MVIVGPSVPRDYLGHLDLSIVIQGGFCIWADHILFHAWSPTKMCFCNLDQRWDICRRKFFILTPVPLFVLYMDLNQIMDLFSWYWICIKHMMIHVTFWSGVHRSILIWILDLNLDTNHTCTIFKPLNHWPLSCHNFHWIWVQRYGPIK